MGSIEEYHASLQRSRVWFAQSYDSVFKSFQVLDDGFTELVTMVQTGRDAENQGLVSLGPMLLIMQRQAFLALDALASMQAYQAWVLLRPGLECVLIMGKWMDDPKYNQIWYDRFNNRQAYSKAYTGKGLISESLPHSDRLQRALSSINDQFVHPNPQYFLRHIRLTDIEDGAVALNLHFFDDHDFHHATVLAMLHLLIYCQDAIAQMFATRFVSLDVRPERFALKQFQDTHRDTARAAAAVGPAEAFIIHELGLWGVEV